MSTIQWGKPKQEDVVEIPQDQQDLLTSNGWIRVGGDLWRDVETTQELSTKAALKVLEVTNLIDTDLANITEQIIKGPWEEEEKSKQEFSFPQEIRNQLHQQFCVITGKAGTGKSTLLRMEDETDPHYIEKGSTTGIAAINCGGRTVNSLLKYFNTSSLELAYQNGRLHQRLRAIRWTKRVLGIDEMSMLDAKQLDIIMAAIQDINMDDDKPWDLGLHLIGDFAQLPPVNAEFCFKADCWREYFEPNVVRLEKIWRQTDSNFVSAINALRAGRGRDAVNLLKKCGVEFNQKLDQNFSGTTLIPLNTQVDIYNNKKLAELPSPMIRIQPVRRGKQAKEWDKNSKGEWGIPFEQRFKLGAYVMILRNDFKEFTYVNGDCGTIESYDNASKTFAIRLVRNNKIVYIGMITQNNLQSEQPNEKDFNSMFYPKEDSLTGQWIIGSIKWVPLRLAYASTIHKSQGLSLDKVQVDSRPEFYGYPSMSYVAISRARTPEGLVIVGTEVDFASKVKTAKDVLRWV